MSSRFYAKVRDTLPPETRKFIRKILSTGVPALKIPVPEEMHERIFNMDDKQLVELDGFVLHAMPNDYIGYSIIRSRNYEPHVTKLVRSILKPGDVFMDVGANIGYFTFLGASLVKTQGKVIAFEPNPQNLHLIYSTMLACSDLPIDMYPFAVSDSARILKFITVGSNGGVVHDGTIDPRTNKQQKHNILVQSVVVDNILEDEPRIDLIKIDIEAHEPAAIRGMKNLLRKHRPKLITEFHPWAMKGNNKEPPSAYLEQLYALGYNLSIIETSGNVLEVSNANEIFTYWEALNSETIHLDLYAQPKE